MVAGHSIMKALTISAWLLGALLTASNAMASGHGPLFGAATPTLGRGAWSIDQAWTMRVGEESTREQMLKTMVTFGITEVLQVSASIPELMSDNTLVPARMMSAMSNDRELEGLVGYRFHRTPVGIGGRRESTLYVGGTVPFEHTRAGVAAGGSIVLGAATGYAGRAHYVWFGGGYQHYLPRGGEQLGPSSTVTFVYGYRPAPFRADTGRPDLRFFIESTFEDRRPGEASGTNDEPSRRTAFAGPTSLWVYKAIALSGGLQWAVYQTEATPLKERMRIAVNFSYFWFR
jgi:hypothetical protein